MEPSKCLCKSGFSGNQCEKGERGSDQAEEDRSKEGLLDSLFGMASYLLDRLAPGERPPPSW